jgi:hypothetical protein
MTHKDMSMGNLVVAIASHEWEARDEFDRRWTALEARNDALSARVTVLETNLDTNEAFVVAVAATRNEALETRVTWLEVTLQAMIDLDRKKNMSRWRVGRKVGRTIYDGDTLVGMMDTPELAALVVHALCIEPKSDAAAVIELKRENAAIRAVMNATSAECDSLRIRLSAALYASGKK